MPAQPTSANPADVRVSHAVRIGNNLPASSPPPRLDAPHRSPLRDFIPRP
jgi:hypothetical protein